MKTLAILLTIAVVFGMTSWADPAQARRDGDSEVTVKQPAAREGVAPNPEAKNRVRDRERSAQGEESLLGRQRMRPLETGKVLTVAVTAPWVMNDAQTQELVDKALVSQKALLNAETEQARLLEELVKASRSGDKEAVEAAKAQIKDSSKIVEQNERALAEDMRALNSRMRATDPSRERPAQKPAGEGAGKGEGEGKAAPKGEKEG